MIMVETPIEIAKRIWKVSQEHKGLLRWKFGAEIRQPTIQEITTMIKKMDEDTDVGYRAEQGGLALSKGDDRHTDVYMFMGEI